MKIGIIGASGKAGTFILREALLRQHDVTAFVRDASKVTEEATHIVEKNLFSLSRADIDKLDVVINAIGAPLGQEQLHVEAGRYLIDILQNTNTKLFVIGGVGSLFVDKDRTIRVFETESFSVEFLETAVNQLQNLKDLQASSIQWTFLSPSALFDPEGPRTGHYIKGEDLLLQNSQHYSYVSYADYAIAVLDEIENPQHINELFTVASENSTAAS